MSFVSFNLESICAKILSIFDCIAVRKVQLLRVAKITCLVLSGASKVVNQVIIFLNPPVCILVSQTHSQRPTAPLRRRLATRILRFFLDQAKTLKPGLLFCLMPRNSHRTLQKIFGHSLLTAFIKYFPSGQMNNASRHVLIVLFLLMAQLTLVSLLALVLFCMRRCSPIIVLMKLQNCEQTIPTI
jgi:hypothetical protein